MRSFAAYAFAMPQGCVEAGMTEPTVKVVLWKNGDSVTLNIARESAEQLHATIGAALKAWPVAASLLEQPNGGE